MKRRGFLSFMGGAAAAGPSLAKTMADQVVSDAGLKAFGSVPLPAAAGDSPTTPLSIPITLLRKIRGLIRKEGIPRFKQLEINQRANHYTGLDPDIACLVSVSGSWKVRRQRQRNIQVLTDEALEWLEQRSAQREWSKAMAERVGYDGYVDWY